MQTKETCPIYYPERLESVITTGYGPNHISCTGTDYVWFSCTPDSLFLTSTVGSDKHSLLDGCGDALYFGRHTVNKDNELIYIDKKYNIIKLSSDFKNKTEFIILRLYVEAILRIQFQNYWRSTNRNVQTRKKDG